MTHGKLEAAEGYEYNCSFLPVRNREFKDTPRLLCPSVSGKLLQLVGDAAEQAGLPCGGCSHQELFSERQGATARETSQGVIG